ncbi:hypothetical protein MMC22_001319 [Lobaria immixta]|nr:hypothetical protein [Lobaria immixta]
MDAENLLQKSLILHEQVLGSSHPETLRSMDNLAWAWSKQRKLVEAEFLARETLMGREQALGFNHPDTLLSMNNLSVILIEEKGSVEEAEIFCKASLVVQLRLQSPDHPDVLESQSIFVGILYGQGNHEDAEQQFRLVL